MNDINKRCMGEFPMFPGWLFFEEKVTEDTITISAYGSKHRIISASADNRDKAIASVLNQILYQYPPNS